MTSPTREQRQGRNSQKGRGPQRRAARRKGGARTGARNLPAACSLRSTESSITILPFSLDPRAEEREGEGPCDPGALIGPEEKVHGVRGSSVHDSARSSRRLWPVERADPVGVAQSRVPVQALQASSSSRLALQDTSASQDAPNTRPNFVVPGCCCATTVYQQSPTAPSKQRFNMDSATGTARQATQLNSSSPSSTAGPITIPYSLLLSPTSSLAPLLSTAFSSSPTSLGLLLISDLPPAFPALRRQLLLLSNAFASLPEASREKYADASSKWSFGWR